MMFQRILLVLILGLLGAGAQAEPVESFTEFVNGFETKAANSGVPRDVYRAIMAGVKPVKNIPGLVSSQPEFTTPIWGYMDQRVSSGRIGRGRDAVARNRNLFDQIGARFGVDPFILAAIWGMESDYGGVLNNTKYIKPIIPSLATLVHHRRGRLEADEQELIAALQMVHSGGWTRDNLVGSWAGAVGHTQLIISGLKAHGTDGDGDGKINPHLSLPDALASTAVYLRSLGYVPGIDWGFEVEVPDGFDFSIATRTALKRVGYFAERGVKRVKGRQFSDLAQAVFLYLPAGQNGPKFLMTPNYLVLKEYNFSDSYALSVAHLTDRLKGAGSFVQSWPKSTKFPNLQQRIDIQTWLKKLGYYNGEVDGRIGPISQEAYQRFQAQKGLVADGFITAQAHEYLRQAVQ